MNPMRYLSPAIHTNLDQLSLIKTIDLSHYLNYHQHLQVLNFVFMNQIHVSQKSSFVMLFFLLKSSFKLGSVVTNLSLNLFSKFIDCS